MAWELLAIWIIVAATVYWFVRDERRLGAQSLQQQAETFATSAAWRHQSPTERAGGDPDQDILALHRKFAEELRRLER